MKAHIVIVGGGVMGTSIAMHAAQRSDPLTEPVVLIERRELGAGSSGRSGAILRQLYADRHVASMARDSLRTYASFEARAGRSLGFRRTGVLVIAGPDQPEWIERLRRMQADLSEMGIGLELVEGPRMRELCPGLRVRSGSVGVWEPEGGFVDPKLTLDSFAALARQYGTVTRTGVEVTRIRVEGGRVVGVETSEGPYEAERVVVVAGPWTARLLEPLGVELPLRVVRPENHFLRMPQAELIEEEDPSASFTFDVAEDLERTAGTFSSDGSLDIPGLHPVVIDLEYGFYCRCEPKEKRTRTGHIDYAAAAEVPDPDALDEEVSEEVKVWARETLGKRLPEYADQPDAGSQAAMYTLTPDAQPIIGPAPGVEGLIVVTGFSGHGFKLAPSVGEGVAQMLAGEQVHAFDAEFFSPSRFRGDEEWGGLFGL